MTMISNPILLCPRCEVFSRMPAGICLLTGEELIFEMANSGFCRLYPGKKMLGKSFFEVNPELLGGVFEDTIRKVLKTGRSEDIGEFSFKITDQFSQLTKTCYFNFSIQPLNIHERNGRILIFAYDVTGLVLAKKQEERKAAYFKTIADYLPAKVSNAHPSGAITFSNDKWQEYSGMSMDKLLDFGYHLIIHPDELPEFEKDFSRASVAGAAFSSEMRFKDKDGNYRWHLNYASPVLDDQGAVKMWLSSSTDIQDIKDEQQFKRDSVALLSHELKSPITAIQAYIQLIDRLLSVSGLDKPTELIMNSIKRVDQLLIQLTQLVSATLEANNPEPTLLQERQATNLNQLVINVLADFRITHPDHTFVFYEQAMFVAEINALNIIQVLINLLNNAIKYAPESFLVEIRLCSEEKGSVSLSVRDYGIGIAADQREKIFERNHRTPEAQILNAGSGIGLYVSKTIIAAHHGKLILESEEGLGSTFSCLLPVAGA